MKYSIKYLIALTFVFSFFSCDEENNITSETQSLPFANKIWYLAELDGELKEVSDLNYISWQLNEGAGFNSYRINERVTVPDSNGVANTFDYNEDNGTWVQIAENVFELKSDLNDAIINGRRIHDKTLYIISQTDKELVADLEKFWGLFSDGTTEENGGFYKLRVRYVSEK